MDLAEQLQIGKDAEDFKHYIDEHPYFRKLVERVKLEYAKQILDIDPTARGIYGHSSAKDSFLELKLQMDALSSIDNAVSGDIYMGQQAYEKLNGLSEEPKGLL